MQAKQIYKLILIFCLVVLSSHLSAFNYNFDFKNNTGVTCNDFHVGIKGQVGVDEYYQGLTGFPPNPFGDGKTKYSKNLDLTEVSFDGGEVEPLETIHIGFKIQDHSILAKQALDDFEMYPAVWTKKEDGVLLIFKAVPVGGCWYEYDDPGNRVEVYVNNDTGPESIYIYDLRWYASSVEIPLDSLLWDAVPWAGFDPDTTLLSPGAIGGPFYIDGVGPYDFVVFGWRTTWPFSADTTVVSGIFEEQAYVTGACLGDTPSRGCLGDMTETECDGLGGVYQGNGTTCAGMGAIYTVRVSLLATSGDNYEDIMVVPNDLVLAPGDQVEIIVDSNIWCPGDNSAGGPGTLTIDVPANTCGFATTTNIVTENDPHADQTVAILGAVDDYDVETLIIDITLADDDCTAETQGADVVQLRLYCNRDVPTLSEWGLIIFSLLILTLITIVMVRSRRSTAAIRN
ncbi:MAG: IPTL-CTERM sorting domain-containing protein [FCB group bacterium]|nr:IPTL-CTERM sorting domain-containing protein [FCB group bacterium]